MQGLPCRTVSGQIGTVKPHASNAPFTRVKIPFADYNQTRHIRAPLSEFLSSSVVERSAVNRLVVGSNPTSGATFTGAFQLRLAPEFG